MPSKSILKAALGPSKKKLKGSIEYFRAVIDAVNDYILVLDCEGRINFINHYPAGLKADDLLGTKWTELIDPEFRVYGAKAVAGVIATKQPRTIEFRAIGAHRVMTWFMVKISPLSPIENGVTMLATDISIQRAIQEKLEKAKHEAENANLAKSAFLANMSHEIRTPLGAVMGFAELVLNPNIPESEKTVYATAIRRNAELLTNIISDILDFSKIGADKLTTAPQKELLSEIISDVSALLKLKAEEKGIDSKISVEGNVPIAIITDSTRVRQIVFNLISNAVKFTERGSVEVKVRLQMETGSRAQLMFEVTDTGIGINKTQSEQLFKPFSQGDSSSVRKYGGAGLGLILSKKLAGLLGGDVVLTSSTPGKGSVFTASIDPGPVESADLKPYVSEAAPSVSQNLQDVRLEDTSILIVDDSIDNQFFLSKLLGLAGAHTESAENGSIALEKVRQNKYDVLLIDLQMPVMDGYETTAELRKAGNRSPIIALTAHAINEVRERCLASGFDSFITKPVDRAKLLKTISEYTKH